MSLTEQETTEWKELFSQWKGSETNYISVDYFPAFLDVKFEKKLSEGTSKRKLGLYIIVLLISVDLVRLSRE